MVDQLSIALDIAVSIMSTSALLVTLLLGFALIRGENEKLLVHRDSLLLASSAFIVASAVSCLSLVHILGGTYNQTIYALIQVQTVSFAVGLGMILGAIARIFRPRKKR